VIKKLKKKKKKKKKKGRGDEMVATHTTEAPPLNITEHRQLLL
jgi:hypothetical protein